MTVSRSLDLPDGYQHHDWDWDRSVVLNDPDRLVSDMGSYQGPLQLYTQHEIFLEGGVIKHTRSSPNWDGGLATFATCKHMMRSYAYDWKGTWLVGLCPAHLASNTVLFAGRVDEVFRSNYDLGRRIYDIDRRVYEAKAASGDGNPRGDIYSPIDDLTDEQKYDHNYFIPPLGHTRSLEFYEKSPGSQPGVVPKWWRDIEYELHGRRPPVFILRPFHLFTKPMLWSNVLPGRATMRRSTFEFLSNIRRAER